jgi:hypothetical protein
MRRSRAPFLSPLFAAFRLNSAGDRADLNRLDDAVEWHLRQPALVLDPTFIGGAEQEEHHSIRGHQDAAEGLHLRGGVAASGRSEVVIQR